MHQRAHQPSNFRFIIDGMEVLEAQWGLTVADAPDAQAVTKIPGMHKVGDVTLKRGVVSQAAKPPGRVPWGDIILKPGVSSQAAKIPGRHHVGDITLKRGIVGSAAFGDVTLKKGYISSTLLNDWTKIVPGGPGSLVLGGITTAPAGATTLRTWGRSAIRKNARLIFLGPTGTLMRTWSLTFATPVDLPAGGDVAMETLTIAHEGLRIG